MKNKTLLPILILVCIYLVATYITTGVSSLFGITTAEHEITRIASYAWNIRIACVVLSMYFILRRKDD